MDPNTNNSPQFPSNPPVPTPQPQRPSSPASPGTQVTPDIQPGVPQAGSPQPLPSSTSVPGAPVDNQFSAPTVTAGPVVSGSFDVPSTTPSPAAPTPYVSPVSSQPFVGDGGQLQTVASGKGRSFKKPLSLLVVLILVLGGGAAAFYFGYYTNPSVVLSSSLSNTGKGYTKLVDYFNEQSKADHSGAMVASGSYKLKSSSFSTDGNLNFQSDGSNTDTTFDVGAGVTRVNVDMRTIKSAGTNPDIYLKATGIKGLASGIDPSVDNAVNQLDGKWIVVDHTLIDNLESQAAQAHKTVTTPTEAQIMDEVSAFGRVNQQYVFTTDKNKAVATVLKKYGLETIGGHKVYHYKMVLVKSHVKDYITAQRDALNASSLGAWLQKNGYMNDVNSSYTSLEKSADQINSSDTFDLWSDIHTRLVYKVRVSDQKNQAANYTDIGLDYKGGSSYPFFITDQSDQDGTKSTVGLIATLDSKANSVGLKLNVNETGSRTDSLAADFTVKPASTLPKIDAPAGAEPLSQAIDQLGLGDLLNSYLQSAGSMNSSANSDTSGPATILN